MPAHAATRTLLQSAGGKLPVMMLAALPALVLGMSAHTIAPAIGGMLAALWLILVPLSVYKRWASLGLPFVAGAVLVLAIIALPFGSKPFIADFWSSAFLLMLGLPHARRRT